MAQEAFAAHTVLDSPALWHAWMWTHLLPSFQLPGDKIFRQVPQIIGSSTSSVTSSMRQGLSSLLLLLWPPGLLLLTLLHRINGISIVNTTSFGLQQLPVLFGGHRSCASHALNLGSAAVVLLSCFAW
jgi:hypothetical protein